MPNMLESRVIVSKKRTRNLLDLANTWKTTVLAQLEEQVLEEVNEPVLNRRSRPVTSLFR
jgi:hypothetical protein